MSAEWPVSCSRLKGDTIQELPQEVAKMTKRMAAAIAGLGLLATTMTACSTLAGAGLGAGAGAAVGAGTGYGAGKGALIGTGVGAAAGAIYGATRK
jgi:predicted small secreted protein